MIISPNENSVWISEPDDFSFEEILLAIFLARLNAPVGQSFVLVICFFGIMIVCPGEMDFMDRTAIASLFSSIILDGVSPETIALKIGCCVS